MDGSLPCHKIIDMSEIRRIFSIFLVTLLTFSLIAENVQASAFEIVSCNQDGTVANPTSGGFFDLEKIIKEDCSALDETRIFSSIVCTFVGIVNHVLGIVYCGMQHALLPVLKVVLTLYICIFGAQILMGMVQISAGDVMMRLVKIGAIWSFASYGSWGIGGLYAFFVGLSLYGISWVLGIVDSDPTNTVLTATKAADVFKNIDETLYGLVYGFKNSAGEIAGGLFSGQQELATFFFVLLIVAAPLFTLAFALVQITLKMFASTMISFLMGVVATAFLIAISPIFLSCMLFKVTAKMFENWLAYMVSYSIQPIITFAILALWLIVIEHFIGFTKDLSNTLAFKKDVGEKGAPATPENILAFCPLEYSDDSNGFGPKIACKSLKTTVLATDSSGKILKNPDGTNKTTIVTTSRKKDDFSSDQLIVPTRMIKESKFIYFLTYHLITLLVIGYAFSELIASARSIAQGLAGSQTAVALGGGFGSGGGSLFSGGGEGGRTGHGRKGLLGGVSKQTKGLVSNRSRR
jgi:type IV secretory pathway VirB6-like protein